MLARAVLETGMRAGHEMIALDRSALDVTDRDACVRVLGAMSPDALMHCAAYTRVDDAEDEPRAAQEINAEATRNIMYATSAARSFLIYPSTDYVFDGSASAPYKPTDPTAPLGAYGASKLEGEAAAREAARHAVMRTSWLYGAGGRNFVSTMLARGRAGSPLRVVNDQRGAPTWTSDLATMMVRMVERDAPNGVYHATNAGETTWFDFARAIFEDAGITADIAPVSSNEFKTKARRPSYSVLDCSTTYAITGDAPHWRDALKRALPSLS
jgi:dTDP-4-dehydrorhamnose reductase